MIRIWVSRHSSVSIREQLAAQLLFAILSRRLAPAERLPSVRDLARRVKVHPNTVSAAYQDLAARGWVKRKAGSGIFVCDIKSEGIESGVNAFVSGWIDEGLRCGFSLEALKTEFDKAVEAFRRPAEARKLLVIHSDCDLARVLAAEIQQAVQEPVASAGLEDAAQAPGFETCELLTTTLGSGAVSQLRGGAHHVIPLRSMEEMLNGLGPPKTPMLIGVVSRSESILKWASLLLSALALTDSDLIQRNPEEPGWKSGLAACDLIVADVLAAREIPVKLRPVVLRLIPESFLQDARKLVTAEKV